MGETSNTVAVKGRLESARAALHNTLSVKSSQLFSTFDTTRRSSLISRRSRALAGD